MRKAVHHRIYIPRESRFPRFFALLLLVALGFAVAVPEGRAGSRPGADPNETTTGVPGRQNLDTDLCRGIAELIEIIKSLHLEQETGFTSKLENALTKFINGQINAAANELGAFINHVEAKRGQPLTNEVADDLIARANALIAAIQNGTAACGGPEIQCPPSLTVSTSPLECCASIDLPDMPVDGGCPPFLSATAYIGAGTETIALSGNLVNFPGNDPSDPDTLAAFGLTPCLPTGTHEVVYQISDNCDNTSTCTFQVTVTDDIPPVAVCDEFTVIAIDLDDPDDCYEPGDGCGGAGVAWVRAVTFDDGSYDNCGNLKWTIQRTDLQSGCLTSLNACEYAVATAEADSIKFYCCEVGTTQTIILRVYELDASGNPATGANGMPVFQSCLIMAEVREKIKPACIPPAHVTVSCEAFDPSLADYGIPYVYDNCCLNESYNYGGQCGLSHTANYNLFDAECNTGTITRIFRVYDCQGQSSQCTQRIVVTDERAPTIICVSGLVVTIMPTDTMTLFATGSLLYSQDNCTPANLLQYGIRKVGEGMGFPVDASGNPITSVDFDCTDLGPQEVQVWVRDCAGNADYCHTIVSVYDPNDYCSSGMWIGGAGSSKKPGSPASSSTRLLELALYPNPANNEVNIQLYDSGGGGILTIYNQLGEALWEHTVEAGASKLNLSLAGDLFSPGIYVISLRSDNGVLTRRLLVSK